ncbi:3-dehydro-L-gulonate 2-dehydrogenase [Mucilaginibacter sp. BT774]|uniref:3-dehydro-L-gulonate 2-dehydrogenase n=1 Tax=Mucilaginibacter sp. BT774 TaxID=3062276 RepID=UPI00267504B7|nr:3-dehydro-L-gulonate 2-dehydrogenase [Mucilaginibacter sp. BT774]MDO3627350.1 3-dehydro-L-gulonate 2-dehydrogenase [Mucilaginibacter sp. BT774]
MKVSFEKLQSEFKRVLLSLNFDEEHADKSATIFAKNSRDGVYTHGLNRFPTFVEYVKNGLIVPNARPLRSGGFDALEQWDGRLGVGTLNATFCMNRAIELARENGIGCVSIRNTNHWMRGGSYGWQAAEAGMIGICFTNTIANMPPWGGVDPRLGNNPLVIAIPREEGHIVLDMAISQYSFGKLNLYKSRNEQLPLPGGYDKDGNLTTDPGEIIDSVRPLPIGFWKGSGLSLVLDLLTTILSQGRSTGDVTRGGSESGVSQVFICIKPDAGIQTENIIKNILDYTKSSRTVGEGKEILYPGENTLRIRKKSMEEGVWVDDKIWEKVTQL